MTTLPPLPKAKDIRLIVSDVDGTLLDSHHLLPETSPTYTILRRLRAARPDLPIVLSTGKPYPATSDLRETFDLYGFNAIHLNGNVLYAPGRPGSVISQTGLDAALVLDMYETCKKAGISLFVYDTDRPWQVLPCKTEGPIPWHQALRAYGEDLQTLARADEAMGMVESGEMRVVKMCVCEAEAYLPSTSTFLSLSYHTGRTNWQTYASYFLPSPLLRSPPRKPCPSASSLSRQPITRAPHFSPSSTT
jgi:hypothetical protein